MPRKIRELIADLKRAKFRVVGGKGDHKKFAHLSGTKVTVSGKEGGDAKHYQEQEVAEALKKAGSR